MLNEEKVGRNKAEQEERIAIGAILQLPERRERLIFGDCERDDIAYAALCQIAVGGMVNGMGAAPHVIWRQWQDT